MTAIAIEPARRLRFPRLPRLPALLRRPRATPTVLQMEAVECGAAALAMVLAHHGAWIPLERLRIECGVSRDGSKASNILRAAKRFGLSTRAFRQEPSTLYQQPMPCIIHWNFNHFVVLEGIRGDTVFINDPAIGRRRPPFFWRKRIDALTEAYGMNVVSGRLTMAKACDRSMMSFRVPAFDGPFSTPSSMTMATAPPGFSRSRQRSMNSTPRRRDVRSWPSSKPAKASRSDKSLPKGGFVTMVSTVRK